MNNSGKIIAAFIIGAVVGAAFGILYAPEKGSETRKKIIEEGEKMSDAIKDKFNKMKEKMNAVKDDMGQKEDLA